MNDELCLRNLEFIAQNFLWMCLSQMNPVKGSAIMLKVNAVTKRDNFCRLDFEDGDVRRFGEIVIEVMIAKGHLEKVRSV